MTPEAPLRVTKNGLVTDGEGWFVINARESRWRNGGPLGRYCNFEGKRRFSQLGFNINVLEPGQAMGMFHRERAQEGFLVLAGECVLIVEGEERHLRAWDFFHCPPETEHIIVAPAPKLPLSLPQAPVVGASVEAWSTPSPTQRRDMAQVEIARRRTLLRHTRRRAPDCRDHDLTSTFRDRCPTWAEDRWIDRGGCRLRR